MFPQLTALFAALLFGASAPFAKLLLSDVKPLQLAGLLYLGSGGGLFIIRLVRNTIIKNHTEKNTISRREIKWLAGAVLCGGIAAPVALMTGLDKSSAAVASLLLNFEVVATSAIAVIFFRERTGRSVWLSVSLITFAGILLSLDISGEWRISPGALGILLACVLWGFDNNFLRNISSRDPFFIVIVKGLVSGVFSLFLSHMIGYAMPPINIILRALFIGFISYGFSLVLFILALRDLGSSRTSALFGMAPFLGAALSLIVFRENQNMLFYFSLPFMITGAWLLFHEKHGHLHRHEALAHSHPHIHNDKHHDHTHEENATSADKPHSHYHVHKERVHDHRHFPDIHHRHFH